MIIWNKYIKAHKEAIDAATNPITVIDWVKKRIKDNKNE
jgi:hypothetical protein